MEPEVLRGKNGIQLSYSLPHRLNDACVYPCRPTNQSQIIIAAHDHGLRVVWYAGRPFKQHFEPKINGNSVDLTADDEEQDDEPEYEEDEDEIDPTRPYHKVLTYHDISLGSAAVKIAVPPITAENATDVSPMLQTHAVIFVACADFSLRIVTIPLAPTLSEKVLSQVVIISGSNSHQDLISDVAATLTPLGLEEVEPHSKDKPLTRGKGADETQTATQDIKSWSLLLASTSSTGTGLLLIHQIPIDSNGRLSEAADDLVPIQRRFLRYPLAKCCIEFNPSIYPSHRHSNLLIASSEGAAVKIYQAIPQASPTKKRRGSAATVDSTTSGSQLSRRSLQDDRVLIDLLPPFAVSDESGSTPKRKRVLDAKWILHGRAVLVLLDDGEWGLWDVEAAGPTTSASMGNLVKGQGNVSGIQGGSTTKFAVRGSVSAGVTGKSKSTSRIDKAAPSSSLAPMTPGTRKTQSQKLFTGDEHESTTSEWQLIQYKQGNLAVQVQSSKNPNSRTQEESVVIGYGSANILIPSIQAYWRSESNGRGSFDGSTTARPITMPYIQCAGEEQRRVQFMSQSTQQSMHEYSTATRSTQNLLVVTSSRLILFIAPLVESQMQPQPSSLPMRLLEGSGRNNDQMLLDSGELDIEGMDRILNGMADSGTITQSTSSLPPPGFGRKSVGFQLDNDDQDVDMDTPTTSKMSRTKLIVNSNSNRDNSARRLFT